MYSKRRQLPLEVSSWMEKDLTLRKITANSCLITNDTRQNIVLSRQFFSDMLNLSFARYRKISQYDFDKRMFVKTQYDKSELSMPGLRPYVDQITFGMNRITSSRIKSSRKDGNELMCPSFLSRPEKKSDPTFNRRQPISSIRQIKTAQPVKSGLDITSVLNSTTITTPSNQRPSTRQQISRERLNRLAQPKGYHPNSSRYAHIRSNISGTTTTAEDLFGKIEQTSQVTSLPMDNTNNISQEKPKSAANDKRFRHLVGVFSEVHEPQTSNSQTVKSIVQANPSLQDDEGRWKMTNTSVLSRKAELKHHRQMLVDKLNSRVDIFLIDVGA